MPRARASCSRRNRDGALDPVGDGRDARRVAAAGARPLAAPPAAPAQRARRATPATRSPPGSTPAAARSRATQLADLAQRLDASPPTTLRFHLYWNAWRDTRSTWMRESAARAATPVARAPARRLRLDRCHEPEARRAPAARRSTSLAPAVHRARRRQRRTTGRSRRCRSTRAVAPGETIEIEVAWTSRVPRTFARTGVVGNYYFIAQWFPKIGVLEDGGWNCHQFHAATEFFADFGVYDVRLTVPTGWIVGATGVERERRDEADRHDDASLLSRTTSTTSPGRRARITSNGTSASTHRACRRSTCGCCCSRSTPARPTGIPARRARRCKLLRRVVRRLPVPDTSRSSIPAWQSGAGGMEYPTLFTAGTRVARAARRRRARGRHRPRSRASVLVRHRRHQRNRTRVDGRRPEHLLDGARARAVLRAAVLHRALLRRLHPVGL